MKNPVKFERSCSAKTSATAEAIWALWSDVNSWPTWDQGIQRAEIRDGFTAGKTFTLVPMGGEPVNVELKTVVPATEFTDETVLPFGVLKTFHKIEREGKARKVTVAVRAEVDPDASGFFSKEIWPHMEGGLPESLKSLIELAERRPKA